MAGICSGLHGVPLSNGIILIQNKTVDDRLRKTIVPFDITIYNYTSKSITLTENGVRHFIKSFEKISIIIIMFILGCLSKYLFSKIY